MQRAKKKILRFGLLPLAIKDNALTVPTHAIAYTPAQPQNTSRHNHGTVQLDERPTGHDDERRYTPERIFRCFLSHLSWATCLREMEVFNGVFE